MNNIKWITKEQQSINWSSNKVIGYTKMKKILGNPTHLKEVSASGFQNEAMKKGDKGEAWFINEMLREFEGLGELIAQETERGVPTAEIEYKGYTFNASMDLLISDSEKNIAYEVKTSKLPIETLAKDYYDQLAYYTYIYNENNMPIMKYFLVKVDSKSLNSYELWDKDLDTNALYLRGKELVRQLQTIIDENIKQEAEKIVEVIRKSTEKDIDYALSFMKAQETVAKNKANLKASELVLENLEAEIKEYLLLNGNSEQLLLEKELKKVIKYKPSKKEKESENFVEITKITVKEMDWNV